MRRKRYGIVAAVGLTVVALEAVMWIGGRNIGVRDIAAGINRVIFRFDPVQEELRQLKQKNPEAVSFASDYKNRKKYIGQPIDISEDCETGQVPLLMQWDKRWGYETFGESIIGLSGCGPTCLAMAYVHLTGDTEENPRTMAEFAEEKGYYTTVGTSWTFWTEGVRDWGLEGQELPLDEGRMKKALDQGNLVVCSMRPGDFTTTGHYILIRGYDENGFFVNDPNRKSNSEKQWKYDTISGQIKNLWVIRADALYEKE